MAGLWPFLGKLYGLTGRLLASCIIMEKILGALHLKGTIDRSGSEIQLGKGLQVDLRFIVSTVDEGFFGAYFRTRKF